MMRWRKTDATNFALNGSTNIMNWLHLVLASGRLVQSLALPETVYDTLKNITALLKEWTMLQDNSVVLIISDMHILLWDIESARQYPKPDKGLFLVTLETRLVLPRFGPQPEEDGDEQEGGYQEMHEMPSWILA